MSSYSSNSSRDKTPIVASKSFVVPVVMTLSLVVIIPILATFLVGVQPHILSLIAQLITISIVTFLLYVAIQKRRDAKREIEELDKILNAQYELDSKQNNFMNSVTKELQPAVTELWSFMESKDLPEQSKKFIEAGLKEITETIETFGFVSKLDPETVKTNNSTISLAEIAKEVEGSVSKGQTQITFDMPENVRVSFHEMLEKVLFALVSNSLEHSGSAGIISVTYKKGRRQGHEKIIVQDNGKGIAKEKLAILFKPLTRVEDTKEFSHQGKGMSLFISRMVMRYMGGDIQAESTLGKGTKMHVILPKT